MMFIMLYFIIGSILISLFLFIDNPLLTTGEEAEFGIYLLFWPIVLLCLIFIGFANLMILCFRKIRKIYHNIKQKKYG